MPEFKDDIKVKRDKMWNHKTDTHVGCQHSSQFPFLWWGDHSAKQNKTNINVSNYHRIGQNGCHLKIIEKSNIL